ncbi:MAG: FkbM family methyltransferase [Oceanipulchritudo sp.]
MGLRKNLKKFGGNLFYRLYPGRVDREPDAVLPEFRGLGPDEIAIDCGANRGMVTQVLAESGAQVYAFEPDPTAFSYLVEATRQLPSVTCLNKAVLDRSGTTQLFRHLNFDRNPERFSESSTLLPEKRNVDEATSVEVEVVDLAAFIDGLAKPVSLIKIDCEGSEYAILNHLIERGVLDKVKRIFVETHPKAMPGLEASDTALRERIKELGLGGKIDLDTMHRQKRPV